MIFGRLIIWFPPIGVAIHAFSQNIHILVFVHNFTLVVTGEAGVGRWAAGMAGGANTISTIVINGEGVVEIGRQPGTGGMASGALPIKMVGRAAIDVTGYTIRGAHSLVIKAYVGPERTLSGIMVRRSDIEMTGLTICGTYGLMIEHRIGPGRWSMA
jgi:hypothetical protein